MDIDARIERRQRRDDGHLLVRDYEALSPVVHTDEPSGRGPAVERLLDHLDPVFDGVLPPNAYVHGPFGAGKSAVVTALFAGLERLSTGQGAIHTSTRAATPGTPGFAYVDMRETASEFAFYHAVLDGLVEERVPEHGIGTADLRERLGALLAGRSGAVVAVDHVGEPDDTDTEELIDLFAGLPSNVSWLAVGRASPEETELTTYTATAVRLDPYRRGALVDVLMTRAAAGLAQGGLEHRLARRIAEWAAGNAHDALAALFVAADTAERAERTRVMEHDVDGAIGEVPERSVSLARVLALPANKQLVLRALVDLDPEERATVAATTEAISAEPSVDLSQGTVKRFLYEMAELGIVERVRSERESGKGRPPSRLELRFAPSAFRRLYDLRQ